MKQLRGSALVMGMLLLALIALLGLAGASTARVELQLAHNQQFRENAMSAASAGIEIAIRHVTASAPESLSTRLSATLPEIAARVDIDLRFLGYEAVLPQLPGVPLAGAHVEIISTGHAARGAIDRQRAMIMVTLEYPDAPGADCEPLAPGVRCAVAGELVRLSWQRQAAH